MKTITRVRTSVKEDRTLAIFNVEGSDDPIFLTSKQVNAATGLDRNFSILKGSKLDVTFYAEGDELVGGGKCTKDNTIVKEFEFELSDRMSNIAAAASFGASMF